MEALNVGGGPLKYVLSFIGLVLIQVLICNNILLFGVAVPMIFIYFIICMPLSVNLNMFLLVSFLLGFSVDLFTDTLGLNSLCCTILALLKKPLFYSYMPKEDKFLETSPSIGSMGWINYLKYTLTVTAIFCILAFGIEFVSFNAFGRILLMAASSTVLTVLLMIGIDSLVNAEVNRWG